jgi:hypothetical protein
MFRLKMYWQEGYHWQEEDFERKWCLECADCTALNFDGTGAQCRAVTACAVNHQLWIRNCDATSRRDWFAVDTVAGGWFHQIRVVSSLTLSSASAAPSSSRTGNGEATSTRNDILTPISTSAYSADPLCFERIGQRYVALRVCNETVLEQLWLPVSFYGPFAILPVDRVDVCLTQQHHPKEYEPIGMKDCSEAKTTRYWQMYEMSNVGAPKA